MLRRLVFGLAVIAVFAVAHPASAQTQLVFDSLTTPGSFVLAPTAPRSAIGQIFNLGNLGTTTNPVRITGSDFAIASATAGTYTNVQVNQYFWATASGATTGTTAAYSTLLGIRTYNLGARTFAANNAYTFNGGPNSFATSISLAGLTTGGQIGFSEVVLTDSGNGLVLNDSVLPVFTTATPSLGSNALLVNGTSGYYRNVNSQSTGNFTGSDARVITGTPVTLGVRLYAAAAAPEPTSLAAFLAGVTPLGCALIRRRSRRNKTNKK